MTTLDRIDHCARAGYSLRRQEIAGTCPRSGRLVSRHRWEVIETASGQVVVAGRTPAQAFKRWQEFRVPADLCRYCGHHKQNHRNGLGLCLTCNCSRFTRTGLTRSELLAKYSPQP